MQKRVAPSVLARWADSRTSGGIHQFLARDAGFVMRALRAIGAIFGAGAGLDREQAAKLDFFRLVKFAMDELRLENQLRQRRR